MYRRRQQKLEQSILYHLILKRKQKKNDNVFTPLKIVTRSTKKHKLWVRGEDDKLKELSLTETLWYLLYVKGEARNQCMCKAFRAIFRMPHTSYL